MIEYPEFGYLPLWSIPIIGGATDEPPRESAKLLGDSLLEAIKQAAYEGVKAAMAENGNHEPKLLYDTEEAASLLGVPESWLAKAAREGTAPCVRMGHYVKFRPEDLNALIEKLSEKQLDKPPK